MSSDSPTQRCEAFEDDERFYSASEVRTLIREEVERSTRNLKQRMFALECLIDELQERISRLPRQRLSLRELDRHQKEDPK